eukprot:68809-Pyramimonas_sp.AAC.1
MDVGEILLAAAMAAAARGRAATRRHGARHVDGFCAVGRAAVPRRAPDRPSARDCNRWSRPTASARPSSQPNFSST